MSYQEDILSLKRVKSVVGENAPALNTAGIYIGREIEMAIEKLSLCIMFAIPADHVHHSQRGFHTICEIMHIEKHGGEYDRNISYPDGDQSGDEWLFSIRFATGPYIFGGAYLEDLFESFWAELLIYDPKYVDTHNRTLFFAPHNSLDIYEAYYEIFQRHAQQSEQHSIEKEIKKAQDRLDVLAKRQIG